MFPSRIFRQAHSALQQRTALSYGSNLVFFTFSNEIWSDLCPIFSFSYITYFWYVFLVIIDFHQLDMFFFYAMRFEYKRPDLSRLISNLLSYSCPEAELYLTVSLWSHFLRFFLNSCQVKPSYFWFDGNRILFHY